MQEILHQFSIALPTSELSSKARLPYACITGYATTPPHGYGGSYKLGLCLPDFQEEYEKKVKNRRKKPWQILQYKIYQFFEYFLVVIYAMFSDLSRKLQAIDFKT